MKLDITRSEYWQLTGLLALSKCAVAQLGDIEKAIRSVLHVTNQDKDLHGVGNPEHIGDAVYSGYSADELMEKLGIGCEEVHNVGL